MRLLRKTSEYHKARRAWLKEHTIVDLNVPTSHRLKEDATDEEKALFEKYKKEMLREAEEYKAIWYAEQGMRYKMKKYEDYIEKKYDDYIDEFE